MSKEGLLIALLISEQSLGKLYNKAEENKVEETKEYTQKKLKSILIIMTRIIKDMGCKKFI